MSDHFVQFYENDDVLIDEVALFIGSGLEAGHAGIVIASRAHLDLLEQRLQGHLPVKKTRGRGTSYTALDATDTLSKFMIDGWPDERRFTTVIGGVIRRVSHGGMLHVRAFGEMVAELYAQGNHEAAIRLEALWNDLAERYSFSLLCAYPINAFSAVEHQQRFDDICCAHARVVSAERAHASPHELHRSIASLQQKTAALEHQIAQHKSADARELQRHADSRGKNAGQDAHHRLHSTALGSYLPERAIEASANAILIASATEQDHPIEYVNSAYERMTGESAEVVLGQSLRRLYGTEPEQIGIIEIEAAMKEKREGHAILSAYHRDGTRYWSDIHIAPIKDDDGDVRHFVVMQYDITAGKKYEAELETQANHDHLTGLANRNLLDDRLRQAIDYAARYSRRVCVVFVDLDNFKVINDTMGHQAGDMVLQEVGRRLQSTVREVDTVARTGGDEFVLILPELNEERVEHRVLQRIANAVSRPLRLVDTELTITCSMGAAYYPLDGETPNAVLAHADVAMYRAKQGGRNDLQFFSTH
ncbi:MAG: diguanylate cyclase [Pseudomonadota bacterium]